MDPFVRDITRICGRPTESKFLGVPSFETVLYVVGVVFHGAESSFVIVHSIVLFVERGKI
jgi:hypothetical protein